MKKLNATDSTGTVVYMGKRMGILITNIYNGYAWVLFNDSLVPETTHAEFLWVNY